MSQLAGKPEFEAIDEGFIMKKKCGEKTTRVWIIVVEVFVGAFVGFLGLSVLFLGHEVSAFVALPVATVSAACVGLLVGAAIRLRRRKTKMFELDNLPIVISDFIELVIKKMRYRKKVRADVMAELISHFEDELRDCKTDGEKQQRAEQLIEEFGDVKLLGVLLRRAKRRCRPLWRTIVAKTFQTIGVLILCFIVYITWFFSGKPTISIDYLTILNQMNRPQLADEDNAWPHYEKVVSLFVKPSEELKKNVFKHRREIKSFAELSENEKEKIKKWVEQNEMAWQEFVAASSKAYFYREYEYGIGNEDKMLIGLSIPDLSSVRYMCKVGRWRARMEIEQGRTKQTVENLLVVARAGRHWRQAKVTIVEQLTGLGISALAYEEILNVIATQKLSATDLNWLQQELLKIYPEGYLPNVNIECERLTFLDVVQHTFTKGGPGGGHLVRNDFLISLSTSESDRDPDIDFVIYTAASMLHVGRDETIAKTNEIYDYLSKMTKMSPYERHIGNVKTTEDILMSMPKYRYSIFWLLMPSFDRVSGYAYRIKLQYEVILTVLALQQWQFEKGDYPENLEQLIVDGYLKELPMDPFSDKPLIYKKTEDDFMLYSVGLNFIDDGGEVFRNKKGKVRQWADEGDAVFWPVQN